MILDHFLYRMVDGLIDMQLQQLGLLMHLQRSIRVLAIALGICGWLWLVVALTQFAQHFGWW